VLRHPVERLWSLYKFCKTIDRGSVRYQEEMLASVDMPFDDWLITNQMRFTDPYNADGGLDFYPIYNVRHALPETRKSQYLYLRPDLGTEIWPFELKDRLAEALDVKLDHHNSTDGAPCPALSTPAMAHIGRYFSWDHHEWSMLTQRMAA
jgi:hypothetical protein